ncbi:MAG: peptide MFS transporter [Bacteroidota bacterium]
MSTAAPNDPAPVETSPAAPQGGFFGHPKGLRTLFFTEMWERFSYYGLRALLTIFLAAPLTGANPGFGLTDGTASAIYGLYIFFVYVLSLPGGWVADNIWGQKKAIFVGGCIIAAGHFTMAGPLVGLPDGPTFFLGLALVAIGTGFLKPNVSSVVGDLYPEGGARRDAGFSVFYMAINIGAFAGPILCGFLGEGYNWHWGFSLAGFGMVLGLIQYRLGAHHLDGVGDYAGSATSGVLARRERLFYLIAAGFLALVGVLGFLLATDRLGLSLEEFAGSLGLVVVTITVGFFAYIIFFGGHTPLEKRRLGVILWLFVLAALFWSGFEQAGSSLNLFAFDLTDRTYGPVGWLDGFGAFVPALLVGIVLAFVIYRVSQRPEITTNWTLLFGLIALGISAFVYWVSRQLATEWEMPASFLQSVNPIFIILLAPVFGSLWVWLSKRNANPSIPAKFGLGLLGLAAGFFVLSWGAANASPDNLASPAWLVVTYFFHTCGELCLSPVGLSSMTKLAPKNRVGQMMGIWFVATALGNLMAGLIAGQIENLPPSDLFGTVAMIIGGGGILALLAAPPVRKLMGDIK